MKSEARPSPSHLAAVRHFEELIKVTSTSLCARPSDLVRQLQRSPATGYRMIQEAEAAGLIERDPQAVYRLGVLARRVGFSAVRLGAAADLIEPLLIELRQRTRKTAAVLRLQEGRFYTGPYSLGRGPDYLRPTVEGAVASFERQENRCIAHLRLNNDQNTPAAFVGVPLVKAHAEQGLVLGVFDRRIQDLNSERLSDIVFKMHRQWAGSASP